MDNVIRFGVSFEPKLLERFDKIIEKKGYRNRSEAIRDIAREYVVKEKKENIVGIIRLIFDPRIKPYQNKIADIENEYHCLIINLNKKYLDHHNCLELIEVKGKRERINKFISKLREAKGVKDVGFEKIVI